MTYALRRTLDGRLALYAGEAFVESFDGYDDAVAFLIDANLPIPPCPAPLRTATDRAPKP